MIVRVVLRAALTALFVVLITGSSSIRSDEIEAQSRSESPVWTVLDDEPPYLGKRPKSLTVESTAYCLTGKMANGDLVHEGAASANRFPLGTKLEILSGSLAGKRLTVTDRHAAGSTGLDVWVSSCELAKKYGRQWVEIRKTV